MQIVIDLSEQDYELACKYPDILFGSYGRAIAKGIPLPKGHGRLIDTSKLEVGEVYDDEGNLSGTVYLTKYDIDNAPTIVESDMEE